MLLGRLDMGKSIEFPWRYFLETGLKMEDKMTGGVYDK